MGLVELATPLGAAEGPDRIQPLTRGDSRVLALDPSGQMIWSRDDYVLGDGDDIARDVTLTDDGALIVVGEVNRRGLRRLRARARDCGVSSVENALRFKGQSGVVGCDESAGRTSNSTSSGPSTSSTMTSIA
jgi:hypothetical protein